MIDRTEKKEFIRQLAQRMNTDELTASQWLEAVTETLIENFKIGKGVTSTGFGGFYVNPTSSTWAFKFNPGQKIRSLMGWSSTHKQQD
ncbi:HU family DNA-binding protein [candidate division KSB1 bacterium]|nr:HU family DNA-binding protein [candidate division KSB1 bacterium]